MAEAYAYRLPDGLDDVEAAPPLCAGTVGYRAETGRAAPEAGSGSTGSGVGARRRAGAERAGAVAHVPTRSAQARALGLVLGAASAGSTDAAPPEPLDSAVLFAPAGELVPVAMRALDHGGTLAVVGIHLSDVPRLDYAGELFREKQLRSVTANTRADGPGTSRVVVGIAAVLNLAGAFLSVHVVRTISGGLVDDTRITPMVIFGRLVGAIVWNLLTWLPVQLVARRCLAA